MSSEGGGAGGQGGLWNNATFRVSGGGDRGRHPCDERPLGGTPN